MYGASNLLLGKHQSQASIADRTVVDFKLPRKFASRRLKTLQKITATSVFLMPYLFFVNKKNFYLIQNARATGFQYERDCQNCCQSTIAAIQDILGVQNESVFKVGSGMADGIGIPAMAFVGAIPGV